MALVKLQFRPGIQVDGSRYSSMGGWIDCDKVRFREGDPEKIGGWQKMLADMFLGTARSLFSWSDLSGNVFTSLGTNLKYYIANGGELFDVTPIRDTVTLANPFDATSGSATVLVTDAAHGAYEGDFVTFSGASAVGGLTLNGEYQIVTTPTANTYTITAASVASSTANGGGASVTAAYQINTGLDTTVYGNGWGAGGWGGVTGGSSTTAWGDPSTLTAGGTQLRLWSEDSFGEDLVMCVRDGGIYYWDATSGTSVRAVALSSLSGAADVPAVARQILTNHSDRKVLAFGCTDYETGVQDAMLIRWSDTALPQVWTPTEDNAAGGIRIPTGSDFISALETKQETLVWSDAAVHSLRYIGPPYIYGITRISLSSIMGPNVIAAAGDVVYWMGQSSFYAYDGRVIPLPCSVKDHVFLDFNYSQAAKAHAGSNMAFNEVWWFYPSGSSEECDRYVVYNYVEQVWFVGTMARTAWMDRTIEDFPVATGTDGYLYYHDYGTDDGSQNPIAAINAYITSGPMEIGNGDVFGFAWRMLPDLSFRNTTIPGATVNMQLLGDDAPGDGYIAAQSKSNSVVQGVTVVVEQFTKQTFFRLRAREVSLKVSSDGVGVNWRLGVPRIDVRSDGKRS